MSAGYCQCAAAALSTLVLDADVTAEGRYKEAAVALLRIEPSCAFVAEKAFERAAIGSVAVQWSAAALQLGARAFEDVNSAEGDGAVGELPIRLLCAYPGCAVEAVEGLVDFGSQDPRVLVMNVGPLEVLLVGGTPVCSALALPVPLADKAVHERELKDREITDLTTSRDGSSCGQGQVLMCKRIFSTKI